MPEFSVKKPLTIFVATIAILVLGIVAYVKMTPDLLPNMDFPYVIIVTTSPGDSPESVEAEITKPLEQTMATLEGIVNVTSNSADSYSMVMLEFEEGTNLDTVGVDIQQKIVTIQGTWDDTVSAPYVLKINPSMLPVAMAAVAMEGKDIIDLSDFMDDTLMARMEGISGVARVTASGTVDQQLHVIISQDKIDALNKDVAKSINKAMDKAAASLKAAKNKITGAMNSMGNVSSGSGSSGLPNFDGIAGDIAAKEAERNTIQNRITQLENIRSAMAGTPVDNSAAIAAKRQEIADCEAKITQLDADIAPVDTDIQTKQGELIAAQAAYSMQSSQKPAVPEAGENDPTYLAALEAWQTENNRLKGEVDTINSDLTALTNKRNDLNNQRTSAQAQLTTAQVELTNLENEGKPITDAEAQARLNAMGLSITPAEIPDEIRRQKDELANVELELAALRAQQQDQISSIMPDSDMMGSLVSGMLQMSSAMSQIDSGLNTIESSRKDALKQADLNNILSLDTVSQLLYAQNFSMPAGYVEQDGISYMVSVGDNFSSVEELQNLVLLDLGMEDIDPICLGDIAEVFVTDNSDKIYTRLGTDHGIMLQFEKQSNYATAEVSENIQERFAELQTEFPGLKFFLLMDQGDYIMYIVYSILESLLFGALFSVLVLFIFLKDIRPTFITLCSIPLSLVAGIVLMYFSGVTLNVISLSALSISVGMLVDNSIVVIENIYRLRAKGANAIQAAVSGAKQVLGAITSSTLTTVCVFLPIVFVEGITRQLFMDMALTMGYALMSSLVVALTFVPAMASKLLKDDKPLKQDLMANVYGKYRYAVAWSLDHKLIVLALSTAMLLGSAGLAISRGFAFMPEMDSNTVTVTLGFDEEMPMEDAMVISDTAIARIEKIEGVDTVGATMATDNGISVSMYVLLPEGTPGGPVADRVLELCEDLDCDTSATSAMMDMSMLTGGSGVSLKVYSNDMNDLQTAAEEIGKTLEALTGVDTVSNGLEEASTAIHVNIDREKAIAKGYTTAQLYMELAKAMTTKSTATSFDLHGYNIDVIVEKPEEKKVTLDNLMSLTFSPANTSMSGEEPEDFTLADVATIEETTSLTTINRDNQQRYLTVSATLADGHNVTLVSADAQAAVDAMTLPDSVTVDFGGENEMIMEAMTQLVLMMALGIMLVYFIMVAQFQSLKSPFIVMFTIPLAFTGGFLALLLTGYDVSIIAMIGFVMLVGIIVNNGIVLVEYINQLRAEGYDRREAILEAGVTRIRPILMTTLTTVLGQLIMATGKDMGTALVQPMAIVCIGGLMYATLMTLFVIPVIYDMVCKNELEIVNEEDLVILDL